MPLMVCGYLNAIAEPAGSLHFQCSVKSAVQLNNAGGDSIRVRIISVSKCAGNPVFFAFRLIECEVIFDSDEHTAHVIVGQLLWLYLDEIGCRFGKALLYSPSTESSSCTA